MYWSQPIAVSAHGSHLPVTQNVPPVAPEHHKWSTLAVHSSRRQCRSTVAEVKTPENKLSCRKRPVFQRVGSATNESTMAHKVDKIPSPIPLQYRARTQYLKDNDEHCVAHLRPYRSSGKLLYIFFTDQNGLLCLNTTFNTLKRSNTNSTKHWAQTLRYGNKFDATMPQNTTIWETGELQLQPNKLGYPRRADVPRSGLAKPPFPKQSH